MKTRHSSQPVKSPELEVYHLRAVRIDSQPESHGLQIEGLLSTRMDTRNGESTPTRPKINTVLTPHMTTEQDFRNTNGSSSHPPEATSPKSESASVTEASFSEIQSPQWSSAIGRAGTGKSGRVIERLMAENDRLRRELKLETLRREEEQKRGDMARSKLDSLQTTNENLLQMREVDLAALSRRERKIDELKGDMATEKHRREVAEKEMKEVTRERDDIVAHCKKEVHDAKERSKRATTQYDVLSQSWNQLEDGYRRKVERLKSDLEQVENARLEDANKLQSLEIVVEQLNQETEKINKAKEAILNSFEGYKKEKEKSLIDIYTNAEQNEKMNEELAQDLKKVLGDMRYVMNLKKDLRETN